MIESTPALAAVEAHWERMANQRMEVPEWETADPKTGDRVPFVLFYDPVSVADLQALNARAKTPAEQSARLVIAKAKDADGGPLFDITALNTLVNRTPQAIVDRIALAMMTHGGGESGLGKPLKTTPDPSGSGTTYPSSLGSRSANSANV